MMSKYNDLLINFNFLRLRAGGGGVLTYIVYKVGSKHEGGGGGRGPTPTLTLFS